MVPSAVAYGYQNCPESHSEPFEFGLQFQRAACRAISASRFTRAGYVQLDASMDDVAASRGATVRIKCEITGYPLPRYVWYKDDVIVDGSIAADSSTGQTRFSIKTTPWGSRSAVCVCVCVCATIC